MSSTAALPPSEGSEAHRPSTTLTDTAACGADWANTPELVLANIFTFLPVLDRHHVAHVCSSWQAASSHPHVWRHFNYGVSHVDDTHDQAKQRFAELRSKHEQYMDLLEIHSKNFSRVHIVLFYPESFQILRKLAEECRSVKVCIIRVHDSSKLSEENRRVVSLFLSANTGLQEIRLKNVNFSAATEINAPSPIGAVHTRSLRKLSLVNSLRQNNLSALMYLINVTELTVVPHQIRFTWLYHLARASLHTLNIVNMIGVWKFDFHILPEESWRQIAQCPQLRVNCYFVDLFNCSKLLCHGIPLHTLVCCEYFNFKLKPLHQVITKYADTLTTFVYYSQNEKAYRCQPQPLAVDDYALAIVENCPKLKTLAIRDYLLSSTLLLMVQLNPSFQEPIIREDMICYRLHIPDRLTLPQPVRDYTEANFSEDKFVPAMSRLLQRDWCPLPKKEYSCLIKARYNSW